MSAKVLGRITTADGPRGPDVELRVSVPSEWIAEGATLEIELPRNLLCAACKGGGCDACDRSGAVSVRGKKDPIERVEVTLPAASPDSAPVPSEGRTLVVRIPDRGGAPAEGSDLPRGHLLLSVSTGPELSRGVSRLEQSRLLEAAAKAASERPALPSSRRRVALVALAVAAIVAALLFLLTRR